MPLGSFSVTAPRVENRELRMRSPGLRIDRDQILEQGHHKVKLSDEEMHRITVWLDSCSIFYGVYEEQGGIAQLEGKVVYPTLE